METTIDKAGRVLVPKLLREALGLTAGTRLEVAEVEGQLVFRPTGPRTRVVSRNGRPVLVTDGTIEPLTGDQVRELVERARR
ncbi:MAG: AbrB/MazE/SpoVT family DNA-binding domain-containing protein [Actinomycetota bacterium]